MTAVRPLAVQIYTFREHLADDPASLFHRIAELGFAGVEVIASQGWPPELRERVAPLTFEATALRRMLDDAGLVVSSATATLPLGSEAEAILDEHEALGNDLLIVSSPSALPGGASDDLARLETLKRMIDQFDEAAAAAEERGMRVGFHNHGVEWNGSVDGRPGWDVFWDLVDPLVVAEVDLIWAHLAGQDPADVIAKLGPRCQLVHVGDGPLTGAERRLGSSVAIGNGDADIAGALTAAEHARWYVVEVDDCEGDVFGVVEQSVAWLAANGFATGRPGEA